MKKYEVGYILRSNLDADVIKATIEAAAAVFTNNGSKVLETKEWGLRDLAYEIDHNKKGYYVWLTVEATVEAINEFNRLAGYSEKIIRHIVVAENE